MPAIVNIYCISKGTYVAIETMLIPEGAELIARRGPPFIGNVHQ